MADFLARLGEHGVTHLTGTPSHWRRALMSPAIGGIAPRYVRLSGEIADQAVLDSLKAQFPACRDRPCLCLDRSRRRLRSHRRAGRLSRRAGRPRPGPVEMKVVEGGLHIRSPRTATGYVGSADTSGRGWLGRYRRHGRTTRRALLFRRPPRRHHQCRRPQDSSRGSGSGDQPPSRRAPVARVGPQESHHRRHRGGRSGAGRDRDGNDGLPRGNRWRCAASTAAFKVPAHGALCADSWT